MQKAVYANGKRELGTGTGNGLQMVRVQTETGNQVQEPGTVLQTVCTQMGSANQELELGMLCKRIACKREPGTRNRERHVKGLYAHGNQEPGTGTGDGLQTAYVCKMLYM